MPAALALFDALVGNGNYAEAAAWGEVYARQLQARGGPNQAEFYARWGDILRRIGRYQEAAKYLLWALELCPGRTEPLFSLLDLCHQSPESYDFATAFADLLNEFGKRDDAMANAILLTSCGVLAERRGDVDAALDLYRRAIAKAGDQIRLSRPLADLLVLLGSPAEAREIIERCMVRATDGEFLDWLDATLWLIDFEMVWRGNYQAAAELCSAALEVQPNRDDLRLRLAQTRLLLGRAAEAQTDYQRICQNIERKGIELGLLARRYHALGIAAQAAGNPRLAEASWRRARELAPEWPYPYVALARALARRDESAAQRELVRGAQQAQESPEICAPRRCCTHGWGSRRRRSRSRDACAHVRRPAWMTACSSRATWHGAERRQRPWPR